MEQKLFKVTIDNITVEVEPGTTILMAARKIGGDIGFPRTAAKGMHGHNLRHWRCPPLSR